MTSSFRSIPQFVLFAILVAVFAAKLSAADSRPNIVFVLCDDLGYGDVGCLNPQGKIKTPHLDRFASQGMKFTDAHSGSGVCTPTRYGIITGRYAWRSKLQSGVLGGLSPRLIEPGRVTVASFLKEQGYATAAIGKWHLGLDWVKKEGKQVTELNIEPESQNHNVDYSQPYANGPNAIGFDYFFGISASLDMVPYTFLENESCTVLPTEEKSFPMMLGRMSGQTRKGPAAPEFDANQVLPRLTEKAVEYVKASKKDRPFFLYLPLASPHTPIVPTKNWQAKSELNPYADFVMQTDAAIGEVLKALDDAGQADNTLVIITSDNGCSPQANFSELLAKGHNPSYHFRGTKADIYEGGHRVPFLARWPKHVPAGKESDQLVCLGDLFATAADVVGAKIPDNAAEDSISFLSALLGSKSENTRTAIVNHSINGSFAIRDGNWKLCLCPGSGGWSAPRPGKDDTSEQPLVQLFDLKADISERVNLVDQEPNKVAELTKLLEKFVADGRSTAGPPQKNAVAVDIWKAGKAAHQPLKKEPAKKKAE